MKIIPLLRRTLRSACFLPILLIQPIIRSPPSSARSFDIDDEEKLQPRQLLRSPLTAYGLRRRRLMSTLTLLLVLSLLVFVTLAYTIYKPPPFVVHYLQSAFPSVLFHAPAATRRIVALTIDDAPSASTAAILDLLARHGAHATFFVIGAQIAAHEPLIARMRAEGHQIANHAWRDEPSWRLPAPELASQIGRVEARVREAGGGEIDRYFRPGSGYFDRAMLKLVEGLGYRMVLGSVYPHDPQISSAWLNSRHVLSMVRPGRVIIMHDRRSYSAEQLRLVLEGLEKGGWEVESVGGLLREVDRE